MARLLDTLPKADGFRLPGEFEPKADCWLGWPERPDVWRNGGKPAQRVWVDIVTAISASEPVRVCVSAAQYANARRLLPPQVRVVEMTCDDTWFRDSGPCFVVNDTTGEVRGVDPTPSTTPTPSLPRTKWWPRPSARTRPLIHPTPPAPGFIARTTTARHSIRQ